MLLILQNSLWAQAEAETQFQLKSAPKSTPIPNCTRIRSQFCLLGVKHKARRAGILSSMDSMGKGLDTWTDCFWKVRKLPKQYCCICILREEKKSLLRVILWIKEKTILGIPKHYLNP